MPGPSGTVGWSVVLVGGGWSYGLCIVAVRVCRFAVHVHRGAELGVFSADQDIQEGDAVVLLLFGELYGGVLVVDVAVE